MGAGVIPDPGFLAGLAVALAATPLVRLLAARIGFVDEPRPDRLHQRPTPHLGGLAVLIALIAGLAIAGRLPAVDSGLFTSSGGGGGAAGSGGAPGPGGGAGGPAIPAGALLLLVGLGSFLVGMADDWRRLSPPAKLTGQVVICTLFLMAAGPGPFPSAGWNGVIGFLWIVGFMNAFNFLDNMDGVLSGVSLISVMTLAGLALAQAHGWGGPVDAAGRGAVAAGPGIVKGGAGAAAAVPGARALAGWLLVLAGALAGFLVFNLPPARIFLGDAGSLLLGGLLSAGAWVFASGSGRLSDWLALPLILAYPLFDITFVTLTRLARRQAPWIGGRDHTTHRLATWLGGGGRALVVVCILAILSAAAGALVVFIPLRAGLALAGLFILAYGVLAARLCRIAVR